MKHFTGVFLFLLFICFRNTFSQNLSAFVNTRNEFYVFEDSFTHQLDYLPPISYKIGGNAVAYVDNQNYFRIYQYGAINTPINGVITDYEVSNDLIFVRTPGSIYAFDQGQLHLLTRFVGPYIFGDSLVGFIDYASRNLEVYYNGQVKVVKEGIAEAAASFIATAGNLFAFKNYDEEFCIYYHDSVYKQETDYPEHVRAGNNVVAYLDQFEAGLRVFYKGETKVIEPFSPKEFFVANDLIAYITDNGDFKIFWNGNVYTMGNYSISQLKVKDNMVAYSDRLNYLFVFYEGKSYQLENFIPDNIVASQNTLYYYDQSSHLKIFSEGKKYDMPLETYLLVSNDYDVVKMQLQAKRFRFFSKGKVY